MIYLIKDFFYYLNNELGLFKNIIDVYMRDLKDYEFFLDKYYKLKDVDNI